jgi:DNA-binding response OmpR family regulator
VKTVTGPYINLPETSPSDQTVSVLAVSPYLEDHACLRTIFSHSNWKVYQALNCTQALAFLEKNRTSVLVCERDLSDGDWKQLLDAISALTTPPLMVVTSKNADDSLWAEVLHLGAYDVLSKPFDKAEVMRIISLAWLHWKELNLQVVRKPAVRAIAVGTSGNISAAYR